MAEPQELDKARKCLAQAEAAYRNAAALGRLAEGVALLDEVMLARAEPHATTARNLAATYAARISARIRQLVDADPALPEPELEHFFKVLLAFDPIAEALPESARALKIEVARRLVDRYYEGHSPEQKQEALDALNALGKPEEH